MQQSKITARYALTRKGNWDTVGNQQIGMTLDEIELPGFAADAAIKWAYRLKEPIYIVDQVRECVPVIAKYDDLESSDAQISRIRRVLVRYERYDPLFPAFFEVQRIDKIVRLLRPLRNAMRKQKNPKPEQDGNGNLLLF